MYNEVIYMPQSNDMLLSSVQKTAEQVLVCLFNRLKLLVDDNKLSFSEAIKVGKELVTDSTFIETLIDHECANCLASQDIIDMRLKPFHRMVMHTITFVANDRRNEGQIDQHILLQFINVLEVALGKCRFDEAEQACNVIIEKMRAEKGVNYKVFFESQIAILEYVVLMTSLGEFLDEYPMRRIDWLLDSMASVSNVSSYRGLPAYSHNRVLPISREDLKHLLLSICRHAKKTIQKNNLNAVIAQRLTLLKLSPEDLFTKLITAIESCKKPDNGKKDSR
jgi:hypothetical protein